MLIVVVVVMKKFVVVKKRKRVVVDENVKFNIFAFVVRFNVIDEYLFYCFWISI